MTEIPETPCKGTIVAFEDENGTIELASGARIRFGASACSGVRPAIGLSVWVMAVKVLPVVGPRATVVNLTGEREPERPEDRALLRMEREQEAARRPFRIDDGLAWLAAHPVGFGADRFADAGSASEFARTLAAHGARIALGGRGESDPFLMEVELPADPEPRARIFASLAREAETYRGDFGVDPDGRGGREITREEALALGDPSAEGAWAEAEGPPRDVGQPSVTLWWD